MGTQNKELPKWLQRSMIEQIQLQERINRLQRFIYSDKFEQLDDWFAQSLMNMQLDAMNTYAKALNMRIEYELPEDFDPENYQFKLTAEEMFGTEEDGTVREDFIDYLDREDEEGEKGEKDSQKYESFFFSNYTISLLN